MCLEFMRTALKVYHNLMYLILTYTIILNIIVRNFLHTLCPCVHTYALLGDCSWLCCKVNFVSVLAQGSLLGEHLWCQGSNPVCSHERQML